MLSFNKVSDLSVSNTKKLGGNVIGSRGLLSEIIYLKGNEKEQSFTELVLLKNAEGREYAFQKFVEAKIKKSNRANTNFKKQETVVDSQTVLDCTQLLEVDEIKKIFSPKQLSLALFLLDVEDSAIIQKLLQAGADINYDRRNRNIDIDLMPATPRSVFNYAISKNKIPLLKLMKNKGDTKENLLSSEEDTSINEDIEDTPLNSAIQKECFDMAESLLKCNAKPHYNSIDIINKKLLEVEPDQRQQLRSIKNKISTILGIVAQPLENQILQNNSDKKRVTFADGYDRKLPTPTTDNQVVGSSKKEQAKTLSVGQI